jgi:quercetin dioxygenase-like cupin family protein
MSDQGNAAKPKATIPADDPQRTLVIVSADQDRNVPHVGLVGDTYTILLSGKDTTGRYCLIDMFVPPGGGPPPHRHDFEETFTLLEGQLDFIFRGDTKVVQAGDTVHIPANSPHQFHNSSSQPARMLCICAPAGQEQYFFDLGQSVATRTSPPAKLDAAAEAKIKAKAADLAAKYLTEFLPHA